MNDVSSSGPVAWRNRPPLSGTDVADFAVLRRLCGGLGSGVHQVGEHFMEDERPVLPFLADGLAALIEVGHVRLGNTDSELCGSCPVLVTASGRARYEDLCNRQGIAPYPAVVIDGTPDQ